MFFKQILKYELITLYLELQILFENICSMLWLTLQLQFDISYFEKLKFQRAVQFNTFYIGSQSFGSKIIFKLWYCRPIYREQNCVHSIPNVHCAELWRILAVGDYFRTSKIHSGKFIVLYLLKRLKQIQNILINL